MLRVLNQANIARVLKEQGFEKSKYVPNGRIKGMGAMSTGFKVSSFAVAGSSNILEQIKVEHHARLVRDGAEYNLQIWTKAIAQYQEALQSSGVVTELGKDKWGYPYLIVTGLSNK